MRRDFCAKRSVWNSVFPDDPKNFYCHIGNYRSDISFFTASLECSCLSRQSFGCSRGCTRRRCSRRWSPALCTQGWWTSWTHRCLKTGSINCCLKTVAHDLFFSIAKRFDKNKLCLSVSGKNTSQGLHLDVIFHLTTLIPVGIKGIIRSVRSLSNCWAGLKTQECLY